MTTDDPLDPFRRASAATRAVAVLLLILPGMLLFEIVMDASYFGPHRFFADIRYVLMTSLPSALLVVATVHIRRARGWAITTGIVLLSLIGLFGLLIVFSISVAVISEWTNWWRGSAMNLRKFSVMWFGLVTAVTAVGFGLRDLVRAGRMRGVIFRPQGFEVAIRDTTTPDRS